MPPLHDDTSKIQVLIDSGLQNQSIGKELKAAQHAGRGFSVFQYARKGAQNRDLNLVGHKERKGGTTVRVFQFFEPSDHSRVQKLIKNPETHGQHTIIVTSPKVFNQPKYRSTLEGNHISVLVEVPGEFQVEHLKPWIERIAQSLADENKASENSPSRSVFADSLEISKRLRDSNSGKLDARQIASVLGISITDLATKVCGVTKQALSQSPTSGGIQARLQPLEDIAMAILWCGGEEAKFRAWLNRPNPDFPLVNGKTPSPVELILSGHPAIVASKVHQLRTGHPA